MPHAERLVGAPQPVSVLPISLPSPPAQHLGDIPVQQVKKALVVQYGPTLQSYNALPVTIGRGAQCDFRLDHPAVFERHAQIFYYQEHYWIKDLTGKNMVQINGRSVEGQGMLEADHRLSLSAHGDRISGFWGESALRKSSRLRPKNRKAHRIKRGGVKAPAFLKEMR